MEHDRSPWTFVGVGCAGLLLSLVLVFAAFLFVGQRVARSVKAQMADPDLLRTKAQAVLHAEAFPEGYEPTLSLSVPLLGRIAVLEQRPPEPVPEAIPARGLFLYLESRGSSLLAGPDDGRLQRLLDVRGLTFVPGETVAGEDLTVGEQVLQVRTRRGRLRQPPQGEREVLLALIEIECRLSPKVARLGVWIGADPAPGRPLDALDLSGTPADPEAVRELMSAFRLCEGTTSGDAASSQSAP